jgi:hypothetical protein
MARTPRRWAKAVAGGMLLLGQLSAGAQPVPPGDLATLNPGRTKAVNALWIENPLSVQFKTTKRVVVAEIAGPAEITMMHFAYPETGTQPGGVVLNRDLVLRIYWDGETSPSVECPLVDFFCDPNGTRDVVNTAMLNVRRGFNAYFPMPFRKSARIELDYEGAVEPGDKLWSMMPCYSYVCYRTLAALPPDAGYFCASWRQEALKLGLRDYVALDAVGKGKFVGWNLTVRRPGSGYPVDENEKFYIDGEAVPSVEFQGLEDSFGFSWGFPPTENMFPYTGYFPFLNGAAAYRFFLQDSISFEKSLKVAIGFGVNEDPGFRRDYSKFGSSLQFSSTVYWYQREPHAPLPPLPAPADREPAPDKLFWPEQPHLPTAAEYQARGVRLAMLCGLPGGEMAFAAPGYSISDRQGQSWNDWSGEVSYCLEDNKEIALTLNLPAGSHGTLRLYLIDPDNFKGGRKETIVVGGAQVGTVEHFQQGRWVEVPVGPERTADGKLRIEVLNGNAAGNAVLSKVEWMEK